ASPDLELLSPKARGLLHFVGVGLGGTIERVAAEDRLREAQKLESLGVLSGGLAHDFNNLLGVALGNVSLVQESLATDHPLQAELTCIQQAIERGAGLTRQMLAYAGKSTPETVTVDLNRVVLELSGLVSPSLGKMVELRCELGQPGPTVVGDPTQLQQVLLNLITNAHEAINGQPGVITLKVDSLSVAAGAEWDVVPGRYAWITCQDDGCGIAPDKLARIFDPFFTTKERGSGLGLSTVLGVVRSHKGDVRVRSTLGQGCSIEVLLPMVTETPRPVIGAGPLVYVVDDEQQLLRVASRMLERLGFEVCAAGDGQELLDRLEQDHREVAAVLMDLSMPRLGGLEASRRLFESRPELPIVLMSGYDREDSLREGVQPNVKHFLAKPFRLEGLRAAMQTAVELPA
ncbi:MAG: response regulator, partial [Candidatus Eremiobacteraeota bacterium]|nr:response regulator [Candidatus Eremiobacteraeota bacterium]